MGSLINSSNILNSLTNSGMRAKNFARLTYAEKFEFLGGGGGVALIKSDSFQSLSWMMQRLLIQKCLGILVVATSSVTLQTK